MKKILKISAILFIITISFARYSETKPIPAFYFDTDTNMTLFIDDNIGKGFYPISLNSYKHGNIDVPKNMVPYLLLKGDDIKHAQLISSDARNLNPPSYLWDYDPLAKIKAIPLSKTTIALWQKQYLISELYISDGNPLIVTCLKENQDKIFFYAPMEHMEIHIRTGLPFWKHKHKFPTKIDRQREKKIPLKAYHITSGAIPTRKEAHLHKNFSRMNGLDGIILDFKSYLFSVQKYYSDFDSFMNESNDYLLSQLSGLTKTIDILKLSKTKVSLRIIIANDRFIQKTKEDLMLWDRKKIQPWTDHYGQQWLDLFSQEGLNYYKKIIELAIAAGADDIQLDYIRFPSEGDTNNIIAKHNKLNEEKYKAIEKYLKETVKITNKNNTSFTADIFGIVLWNKPKTTSKIGQNLLSFMRYVDVIAPMLYPSHFHKGFEGIDNPGTEPYLLMAKGTQKFIDFQEINDQYKVKCIPWIQAFNYMSPNYDNKYINEQIKACIDKKMDGIYAWNARNDYKMFYKALKSGILE